MFHHRIRNKIDELLKQYNITEVSIIQLYVVTRLLVYHFQHVVLAMAEAERYLPSLIDKIEVILDEVGLRETEIVIRMSGLSKWLLSCSNG